jgi:5'-phosphate synthase pdxT subunit
VTPPQPELHGVLALQGDFAAHAAMLESLGAEPLAVRTPDELARVATLCMPGGESTTMSLLLGESGLRDPLRGRIAAGMPVLATCAGAILLARELTGDDGSIKVRGLGLLDAVVERNAYGRQADSFEAEVEVDWPSLGQAPDADPLKVSFIRAPIIRDPGTGVTVAARHGEDIVLVRQGSILAATFHPEMRSDPRLHRALLQFAAKENWNHRDTEDTE